MSITTEEQRRQLEAAGWNLRDEATAFEAHIHLPTGLGLRVADFGPAIGVRLNFLPAGGLTDMEDIPAMIAALAILQIPIPGYKIIREEEAPDADSLGQR